MTRASAQLLVYTFGPDADFEGQLVGALERLESGGTLRVVDALFVKSDAESGELVAIDLQGRGASAMLGRLLGFRLDPAERRKATERALASRSGATARALGERLEPGGALAAVLVQHVWAEALADAIARTGGTALLDEFVDAKALADVEPELTGLTRAMPGA